MSRITVPTPASITNLDDLQQSIYKVISNIVTQINKQVIDDNLDVTGHRIINVAWPSSLTDAANKQYVDQKAAASIARIGGGGSGGSSTTSQISTVLDYGARGDRIRLTDGAMTAASAILTSASASWSSADIGKHCLVKGAGPNAGCYIADYLETTIVSITDTHTVVLADVASTTVTDTDVAYGTDVTTQFQAAIDGAKNINQILYVNGGDYVITSPLLIDQPLTVLLDKAIIECRTDSVFHITSDDVLIDGLDRAKTQLTQVSSTGNVIRIDCNYDYVTIRNCFLQAPPRWYDEANLTYGNAICVGGCVDDGSCANDDYSTGHVYENNYILSGQNGIVLFHQDNAIIRDNYFSVTDRTGSQQVAFITFGDYKGLSHVTLVQSRFCKTQGNEFTDPVGIPNAYYDRRGSGESFPADADNEASGNTASGMFRIEIFNAVMPRASITDNMVNISTPDTLTTGIRFAFGSDGSKAVSNTLFFTTNTANLGNGILILGQDGTNVLSNILVANNTISTPAGGVLIADFTDTCTITNNATKILPNTGSPGAMIGISAQGTLCTNHTITNNTDIDASTGINLQGAGVSGILIKTNNSINPTSVGITVQDGAGVDCVITGNTVRNATNYGVNIAVTAVGPVTLGHNYIFDAGLSEYNRGIADIVPERHQDTNIRKIGIGQDPVELVDIRDDVLGSPSIQIAGNKYRRISLIAASDDPGSDTACIYEGIAEGGTIDVPTAVGTDNQEAARLDGRVWDGTNTQPVSSVSLSGSISGGNPRGQINVKVKMSGSGTLDDCLVITDDGTVTLPKGIFPVTNLDHGTGASATTFWRGDGHWGTAEPVVIAQFTPSTIGWYRLWVGTFEMGGTLRIVSNYDSAISDIEAKFTVSEDPWRGNITQTYFSNYRDGVVDQIRISGTGSDIYLDIHVSTATSPAAIYLLGIGGSHTRLPDFESSITVGAVAGSDFSTTLQLGSGFRATSYGSHISLGTSAYESNWQTQLTSPHKAIFASNVYWDGSTWQIADDGSTAYQAVVLESNGDISLAAEGGLTLPTTRSAAQFNAGIKHTFNKGGGGTFLGDGQTWAFGDSTSTTNDTILQLKAGTQKVRLLFDSSSGSGEIRNSIGAFVIANNAGAGAMTITNSSSSGNLSIVGGTTTSITITPSGSLAIRCGSSTLDIDSAAGDLYLKANSSPVIIAKFAGNVVFPSYGSGFIQSNVNGTLAAVTPSFTDINGTLSSTQLPATGLSTTVTIAALSTAGTPGTMTFSFGLLTGVTPAT